ncbi:Hypothetical protein FKW44_004610 [Caligus rogercresseyi]|uniref:Uncharacterized protein n=1 Tax=Caligus rogercresseyi TaxID=217165 RepID=A0A7T8KB33_CALRO|nr:Hypothetical protein FKW44_004610 [Caligus rogercresseyi]
MNCLNEDLWEPQGKQFTDNVMMLHRVKCLLKSRPTTAIILSYALLSPMADFMHMIASSIILFDRKPNCWG